jgi:hypothetical protein
LSAVAGFFVAGLGRSPENDNADLIDMLFQVDVL